MKTPLCKQDTTIFLAASLLCENGAHSINVFISVIQQKEGSTSSSMDTTTAAAVQCVLDNTILNRDTIYHCTNIGLSIFAVLCGKNRGVFVLNDPITSTSTITTGVNPFVTTTTSSGNTYSCLTLPPSFQGLLSDSTISMSTSNDIGAFLLSLLYYELINFVLRHAYYSSNWKNNPHSSSLYFHLLSYL
jgi:hypothetical protein